MKFEAVRIHFLGDVFAAAAVVVVVGARFEGEERARVLFSRAIAHLAPHISYGAGHVHYFVILYLGSKTNMMLRLKCSSS